MQEASAKLREAGVSVSEPKLHPDYAPDYFAVFFSDPDGIRLEITNYRAQRRQRHDNWESIKSYPALQGGRAKTGAPLKLFAEHSYPGITMVLLDSIDVHASRSTFFEFFEDMDNARYLSWHPDHKIFRWTRGKGVSVGNESYFEEVIAGKLLKKNVMFSRVEPEQHIEFVPTFWLMRLLLPRARLSHRSGRNGQLPIHRRNSHSHGPAGRPSQQERVRRIARTYEDRGYQLQAFRGAKKPHEPITMTPDIVFETNAGIGYIGLPTMKLTKTSLLLSSALSFCHTAKGTDHGLGPAAPSCLHLRKGVDLCRCDLDAADKTAPVSEQSRQKGGDLAIPSGQTA